MEEAVIPNKHDWSLLQQSGLLKDQIEVDATWNELTTRCPQESSSVGGSTNNTTNEIVIPAINGNLKPPSPSYDICIAYSQKNGTELARKIKSMLETQKRLKVVLATEPDKNEDLSVIEARVASSVSLVVLLTAKSLSEMEVVFPMTAGKHYIKNLSLIILVHDAGSCFFPGYNEQPPSLSEIFSEKAVTFLSCYAKKGIQEIAEKYHIEKQILEAMESNNSQDSSHDEPHEDISTDAFLSHKRSSGQGIAGRLYEGLKTQYKVFLDSEAKFKIHNLEKIVENTNHFVFILTSGIFLSKWCLEELRSAVKNNKHIIVIRELGFLLPDPIPEGWARFEYLFRSPEVLVWSAEYNESCIVELKKAMGPPQQYIDIAKQDLEYKIQLVESKGILDARYKGNLVTFFYLTRDQPVLWEKIHTLRVERDSLDKAIDFSWFEYIHLPNLVSIEGNCRKDVYDALPSSTLQKITKFSGITNGNRDVIRINMDRKLPNVEIATNVASVSMWSVVSAFGPNLRVLNLKPLMNEPTNTIKAPDLKRLTESFPKLEVLNNPGYLDGSAVFPHVVEVSTSNKNSWPTLCQSFPNLRKLTWEIMKDNPIQWDLSKYLTDNHHVFDKVESLALKFPVEPTNLRAFAQIFPAVKHLSLESSSFAEHPQEDLLADISLFKHIQRLKIKGKFSEKQLLAVAPLLPQLDRLFIPKMPSQILELIAKQPPKLQVLMAQEFPDSTAQWITDNGLSHLTKIRVAVITSKNIDLLRSISSLSKLITLKIDLQEVSSNPEVVKLISTTLPRLKKLYIKGLSRDILDAILQDGGSLEKIGVVVDPAFPYPPHCKTPLEREPWLQVTICIKLTHLKDFQFIPSYLFNQ